MKKIKKQKKSELFYLYFKKHKCPVCGRRLKVIPVIKTVYIHGPDDTKYDFPGRPYSTRHIPRGDTDVKWRTLHCSHCSLSFTGYEIKKSENIDPDAPQKPFFRIFLIIVAIAVVCAAAYLLYRYNSTVTLEDLGLTK